MMKVIAIVWVSCLVAVAFILPAKAEDCVFCEVPPKAVESQRFPFGDTPIVAPQVPSNPALDRYLDAQTNATNESLSIYKYQAGILSNPQAQQQINIDRMMQDLRIQLQGRR